MIIFSFGGGVQSHAVLSLIADGKLEKPDYVCFANVGEDSENPGTLKYIERYTKPFCQDQGLEFIELRRTRKGEETTILQEIIRPECKTVGIPVHMASGAPGNRNCTKDFKRTQVAKFVRLKGATRENPAIIWLGISIEEAAYRMRNDSGYSYETLGYPLVDLGISRASCEKIILSHFPVLPPKSSCWFCPFQKVSAWQSKADNEPGIFQDSVSLEQFINFKRSMLGHDKVFLAGKKPLAMMVKQQLGKQLSLWEENDTSDLCTSSCWT